MWNVLVGGLLIGASVELMDGQPAYPDAAELSLVVADERVAAFGWGAALLVQSAVDKARPASEFDLSSLRAVTPTGSPLLAAAYRWVNRTWAPTSSCGAPRSDVLSDAVVLNPDAIDSFERLATWRRP